MRPLDQGGTSIAFPASLREQTFNAARDVLRERGFVLDRVDLAAGVITTRPMPSGGLATPWRAASVGDPGMVEDTLHGHARVVRITLSPGDDAADQSVCDIVVAVQRTQRPLVRPQPRALGLSRQSIDPLWSQHGLAGEYDVPITRDDVLGKNLARDIAQLVVPGG